MAINDNTRALILKMQHSEITEYAIYQKIALKTKDAENKAILIRIGDQEKAHADIWQKYTGQSLKPKAYKVFIYTLMHKIFGLVFVLRLMERGENFAQSQYESLANDVPEALLIHQEEAQHEQDLIDILTEERLQYIRSIVLGLNDALVELTGALAGLTFAISNTQIISLSGLITGIAASMSMAASEYLSTHAEGRKDALKSSIYTGTAYVIVVSMLIIPYLLLDNRFIALAIMLSTALVIIFVFNYYMSIALNLSFKKRFLQMAIISMGVATISFVIGLALGALFGVDI